MLRVSETWILKEVSQLRFLYQMCRTNLIRRLSTELSDCKHFIPCSWSGQYLEDEQYVKQLCRNEEMRTWLIYVWFQLENIGVAICHLCSTRKSKKIQTHWHVLDMLLNIRGSGKIKRYPLTCTLWTKSASHAYDLYHTLKFRSCYLGMA